jgi:zinc protease
LIGAARSVPDEIAARVMNEILGGLFSSRINLNLREANGYTYGAFSQFTFRRTAGPFSAGAGVRADVTTQAAQEIVKEMKKLADAGVSGQELAMAKDSYARSLPGYFETTDSTVASLSSLFVYGLPMTYYLTLPDEIQGVTAQAVQAAAKKYLVPEKFVVIAVGDRAKIGSALEAAFGPAEIRDPDGMIVR